MLQPDPGYHTGRRGLDHICGIQTAAQAGFQHDKIALCGPKIEHPNGGHQLKFGLVLRRVQHSPDCLRQGIWRDRPAVYLKALVEPLQMGGGIQPRPQSGLGQGAGQQRRSGTLSVGAGDVDKPKPVLRSAQPVQQAADALQAGGLAGPGPLPELLYCLTVRHGGPRSARRCAAGDGPEAYSGWQ